MSKKAVTIAHIRDDEWINPFGATLEELIVSALEENGLMTSDTAINGRAAKTIFQEYCQKKALFQETTRLGNLLLKSHLINAKQLAQALELQRQHPMAIGQALITLEICTQAEIDTALAEQLAAREEFYRQEQARHQKGFGLTRLFRFLAPRTEQAEKTSF